MERVEIGPCVLYRGEAIDVMGSIDDSSIDCVVMDPPYCAGAVSEAQRTQAKGQGLRSENLRRFGWFVGDNMGTAGLVFLLRTVAAESLRVVRPHGSLLAFCDWRMVSSLQPAIESAGLRYQNLVVWDKESMGLGTGFRSQHELILHFTYGSPVYHDMGTSNVIRSPRVRADDREHQTQKPEWLMKRLLKVVCPKGGTVLDPFMGSGSTGVAAVAEQREFIGIERDPTHFETACKRIREAVTSDRNSLFPAFTNQEQV